MQNIDSDVGLKEAIQQLEHEQALQGKLLREQFDLARETIKPVSLIKSTFDEVVSSPMLISNILGATIGLSAGFISKRMFVGPSVSPLKKLIGNILQVGVTAVLAKKPEMLKTFGNHILQRIFNKKKTSS